VHRRGPDIRPRQQVVGRVLPTATARDNGQPTKELMRKLAEIPLAGKDPKVL
jgi:hypothetical protein